MTALLYSPAGPTTDGRESSFRRRLVASVLYLVIGGALVLAGTYLTPLATTRAVSTPTPTMSAVPAPYDSTGGLLWNTYREVGGTSATP
jgi:hypothetical protein